MDNGSNNCMDTIYTKRILVTGGAGFIGSTFLNQMTVAYPGYLFVNLDALTPVANITNVVVADAPNYVFVEGDIRDSALLQKLHATYTFTDIIHFAAETHVDVSIEDPLRFIETNVLGTGTLLSFALEHTLNRFLHVSTDEVYGALEETDPSFTEETPLAPNSPYSASKAGSDMLVRAYHKTYGLDVVITRCSNNFGPRQDVTKFIPRAITSLLRGESIPVYGKGAQVRDWLYVDDHVRGIDIAFHHGVSGEVYNIGGGTEIPNIEIAQLLTNMLGKPDAITFVEDRKGHDFRYSIDDTKIRALGYTPQMPFTEGLKKTVSWYEEQRH
jgi:dTDP-glucose 4,6-dehydratase